MKLSYALIVVLLVHPSFLLAFGIHTGLDRRSKGSHSCKSSAVRSGSGDPQAMPSELMLRAEKNRNIEDYAKDLISSSSVLNQENTYKIDLVNNADSVIRVALAEIGVKSKEAQEIAHILDFINDNILDSSKLLKRPDQIYLMVTKNDTDAFWTKSGVWQFKVVVSYSPEMKRLINTEKKGSTITLEKNPSASLPINAHEYFHVVFDNLLKERYGRIAAINDMNTYFQTLRHNSHKTINRLNQMIAEKELRDEMPVITEAFKNFERSEEELKKFIAENLSNKLNAKEQEKLLSLILDYRKNQIDLPQTAEFGKKVIFGKDYKAKTAPKNEVSYLQNLRVEARVYEKAYLAKEQEAFVLFKEKFPHYTEQQFKELMGKILGEELESFLNHYKLGKRIGEALRAANEYFVLVEQNELKRVYWTARVEQTDEAFAQAAQVYSGLLHTFISKYHELIADIGTVLTFNNDGKAVSNALTHTMPNRYDPDLRMKNVEPRDFTSKNNRVDKFVYTNSGHNYFAPVRKWLYDTYLKMPITNHFLGDKLYSLDPETKKDPIEHYLYQNKGIIIDNVLNAILKELDYVIGTGAFAFEFEKIIELTPKERNVRFISRIEEEFEKNPLVFGNEGKEHFEEYLRSRDHQ